MNRTYLSQIDISNFRSFGPGTTIKLPATPGLFIVYGMNGLGKTTFFEAMEWALTGDVRRISREIRRGQLDSYLTRHDAEPRSHRVSMHFDGVQLTRSADVAPQNSEVVNLLCRSDWRPKPSDTAPYFRLTMFLPQSKKHRFDVEKPADQWKLLEGPAGVDRLNRLRDALGSRKTKNAFSRAIDKIEAELTQVSRELADWNGLLALRADSLARNAIDQAVTPEEAAASLDSIVATMMVLPMEFQKRFEELDRMANVDQRVMDMVRTTDLLMRQAEEQLQSLKDASLWVAEWAELQQLRQQIASARVKLANDSFEVKRAISENDATVKTLSSLVPVLHQQEVEAISRAENLRVLIVAAEASTAAAKAIANLERRRVPLAEGVDQATENKLKAVEVLRIRLQLATELFRVGEEERTLEQLKLVLDEYLIAMPAAIADSARLEQLTQEQLSLSKQKPDVERRLLESQQLLTSLRAEKETALIDAEHLAKALASICEHIFPDGKVCPVCRTEHDRDELYRKSQESLRQAGGATPSLDIQIQNAEKHAESHSVRLKNISDQLERGAVELTSHSEAKARREAQRASMEVSAIELGLDPQDLGLSLALKSEVLRQQADTFRSELAELPSQSTAEEASVLSQDLLRQAKEKLASVDAEIAEVRQSLESNQALMHAAVKTGAFDPELLAAERNDLLETILERQSAAAAELRATSSNLESAKQRDRELREREATTHADIRSLDRRLLDIDERSQLLLERWRLLSIDGLPDASAVRMAIGRFEDALSALRSVRRKTEMTGNGFERWSADAKARQIASDTAKVRETLGVSTDSEATDALSNAVAAAEGKLRAARKAASRAEVLANSLGERADEFNDLALKPLTSRIQQYHDVLSPFRYRIGMSASGGAARPSLKQTVIREGANRNEREVPPLAELSDGQVSVQSLSTLFSASTEYRWCRWPALLLDDPLQSSDVLHAAAFLDILRGLILNLGYQIFLSSHDLEEAKYIIRKCGRSSITVTQCHLLGPGVNGVRYNTATSSLSIP